MPSRRPDAQVHVRDGIDDPNDLPKLGRRDIWHLIWATYATTFPLLLVFLLGLGLATWIVTELVF